MVVKNLRRFINSCCRSFISHCFASHRPLLNIYFCLLGVIKGKLESDQGKGMKVGKRRCKCNSNRQMGRGPAQAQQQETKNKGM